MVIPFPNMNMKPVKYSLWGVDVAGKKHEHGKKIVQQNVQNFR